MRAAFLRAFVALLAVIGLAGPLRAQLTIAAWGNGAPVGTSVVPPPAGLGMTVPLAVWRRPDGSYAHDFDPLARRPAPMVTVYVGAGGDNAKDCLSWANRCRSLKQGIVRSNAQSLGTVVRLLAQVGIYKTSVVDGTGIPDSFGGQAMLRDMVIEPCDASGNAVASGQIVSVHDQPIASANWTLESGSVYSISYNGTTELPNDSAWDAAFSDSFGRPRPLVSLYSDMVTGTGAPHPGDPVGAVNYVAGLYGRGALYRDTANRKIYVRLSDNRAPDSNLVLSRGPDGSGNSRHFYVAGNVSDRTLKIWARNIDIWGGIPVLISGNEATNKKHDITLVDFFVGYGRNVGVQMSSSGAIALVRGKANSPAGDSYTYTLASDLIVGITTSTLDVLELDCQADWVGQVTKPGSDRSTNGSSIHYGVRAVRVNGSYGHITDRVIHDIQSARSWNLGLHAGPSLTGGVTSSGAVASGYLLTGTGAQTAKVWVDGLSLVGPMGYGLQAYDNGEGGPGGTLYVRNTAEGGLARDVRGGSVTDY